MHFEGLTLREALLLARSKRPLIYPNKGFYQTLFDFEKELFSINSIPQGALHIHEDWTK